MMETIQVQLENKAHSEALIYLMNIYMMDPMGGGKPMDESLPSRMLAGLKAQPNYVGFLIKVDNQFVALANCFVNFSTFKAKQLINIHDFIVHPDYRKNGLGETLLGVVADYGRKHNMCRVSLEVREDNDKAQRLYKRVGFEPCKPNMFFWEYNL